MGLKKYVAKRNFKKTSEPRGRVARSKQGAIFVVQKHYARNLHYDFRLELGGTLKSWAVPKGPSMDPQVKRLAVEVEDHPVQYASFEGDIPEGEYGAGHVEIWDEGRWEPPIHARADLKKGHLNFELKGKKLKGYWSLIRTRASKSGRSNWLLVKRSDDFAKTEKDKAASRRPPQTPKKTKDNGIPFSIEPQLALLVSDPPQGDGWIHELKFDGYRTLAHINDGTVRLITRNGKDWTGKYGPLVDELKKFKVDNAVLDGEIVWVDSERKIHFQGLQNALAEGRDEGLAYYFFDLLFLHGEDLRDRPLLDRKILLKKLLNKVRGKKRIFYSDHWKDGAPKLYEHTCLLGLEGIVSKRADAAYRSGRNESWQKTKCSLRQEFVIGGYTQSPSDKRPFGALLLGFYEDQKLVYAGRVGTGFTNETFGQLMPLLEKLRVDRSPFNKGSPRGRSIRWIKPKLMAEVEFKAWTKDRLLRQASYQGLREDKKPIEIHKEESLELTHPDRVVYRKTRTTKQQIYDYYETVSPLMLPLIVDRPLSIVRCQQNTSQPCFFQKHADQGALKGLKSKPVSYKNKEDQALVIENSTDLLEFTQAGGIELHCWNAHFSQVQQPDQIVFDLDPESARKWPEVVDTAFMIRDMLKALKLKCFLKVTGGKGLHIHLPFVAHHGWDEVKHFAKSLMQFLEKENPKLYTTNMRKSERKNRIFLDYLRNGYGATAVAPYSLRARERPTVALPISWKELSAKISPDQFELSDAVKLLKKRKDPWQDYNDLVQKLPNGKFQA